MGYFFSLSKSATENWLDASEITLLICGLVLAYGAAGEYLEEHEKLPRWMQWSREPKLVFVWMVAISLFGEFAGDAGVYLFSGHLQSIADTELTQLKNDNLKLQGQVGDAAEKLRLANIRFDVIEKKAGTLDKQLVAAEARIVSVTKDSDLVQYVLSARHIQDEVGIEKELRAAFKGSHIVFASYWDDESIWLCNQLAKIADKAEVGPINKCGEEPLVPGLPQLEDLYLEGPNHEQLERLSRILKSPKRVPGIFVGMREQPTLKVLVGIQRKIWLEHQLTQQPKRKSAQK